jgi:phosphoenolpyruvate carboxykinase (ATP)
MNHQGASRLDDLTFAELLEHALAAREGQLSTQGALVVQTERHVGVRRFLVKEPSVTDVIRADAQFQLLDPGVFKGLWERVKDTLVERTRYRLHAHLGIDPEIAVPLEITTLKAWHAMSCHQLCHIPTEFNPKEKPVWKVIWAPADALGDADVLSGEGGVVLMHVGKRRVLVGGDLTTGEMRRALLTVLGLLLPEKQTLPLHGAAAEGDGAVTLFLGPAGTQKTTWALKCGSLIGDRGLSWSATGLHRLADGCRLHLDHNLPISLDDALSFGTVAENLPLGLDRQPLPVDQATDPDNPVHLVLPLSRLHATETSDTRGPSQLVILATDPLGVLPPLARLSQEQTLAWFILGYGNHLGPLESRVAEIDIRFTPGFMDTLLPRNLSDYVHILEHLMQTHQTRCFLVNAGWHGAKATRGEPLSASEESAVITSLYYCTDWEAFGALGLEVPAGQSETAGPWHPQARWDSEEKYQRRLNELISAIQEELMRHTDAARWLKALDLG